MKRRNALVLIAAAPCLCAMRVLPPESERGFAKLIEQVNRESALGGDVRITGIRTERDRAIVGFWIAGAERSVALLPRGASLGDGPRFFRLERDAGAWRGHEDTLRSFTDLLDGVFSADPWIDAAAGSNAVGPTEPAAKAPFVWRDDALEQRHFIALAAGFGVAAVASVLVLFRSRAVK